MERKGEWEKKRRGEIDSLSPFGSRSLSNFFNK